MYLVNYLNGHNRANKYNLNNTSRREAPKIFENSTVKDPQKHAFLYTEFFFDFHQGGHAPPPPPLATPL